MDRAEGQRGHHGESCDASSCGCTKDWSGGREGKGRDLGVVAASPMSSTSCHTHPWTAVCIALTLYTCHTHTWPTAHSSGAAGTDRATRCDSSVTSSKPRSSSIFLSGRNSNSIIFKKRSRLDLSFFFGGWVPLVTDPFFARW